MPADAVVISSLSIYPVKSCQGIALPRARLTLWGLEHDRSWMIVDPNGRFLTQRRYPRMALIATAIEGDALVLEAPGMPMLMLPLAFGHYAASAPRQIRIWIDEMQALDAGAEAAQWFSACLGTAVRLVRFDPAVRRIVNREWTRELEVVTQFADGFPLLVIGEASLHDLNARLIARGTQPVPMNRFRPNIVLSGVAAYEEDRVDSIGFSSSAVSLKIVKPCARCPIPTIDQAAGSRDKDQEPLETLRAYRVDPAVRNGATFGQNAVVLEGAGEMLECGQLAVLRHRVPVAGGQDAIPD